ncbi:MAG: hypothetical protein H7199_05760 [Burkholderiales bacterium]|nr:hypothetical protein [Flavobacterium sp.]
MNRFFGLFFLIFGVTSSNAQIHEIGVFLGGSNYIGDIGKMDYIAPNEPAFGLLYKWNKSPRHSWRISFMQSKITGNDKKATAASRKLRNYSFANTLQEISAGLEFDFFNFDLHDSKPKVTPYLYSGLSYLRYDGLYFTDGELKKGKAHGSLAIPIVLGIKGRLMDHLILGVESGVRFALHDDLDGSNPYDKRLTALKFGNTKSNDWYVFTGFTLTYTFGNKPCFCAD